MKQWLGLVFAAFALTGCQLQPLYSGGSGGQVATTLSAVTVTPIEGQVGWLVYNKLRDRLGAAGTGAVLTASGSGSNAVSTWNWNAVTETLTQTAATVGAVEFDAAGPHVIELVVAGKNAASNAFTLSADKFTFVPR